MAELHYLKFKNLINVVETLRENDLEVELLEHLNDEQLSDMFKAPGTFIRMQGHVKALRTARRREARQEPALLFSVLQYRVRSLSGKRSALHLAIVDKNVKVVKRILQARTVNVNAVRDDNASALHLAVSGGDLQIVKLLLRRENLSLNDSDSKGNTAFSLAVLSSNMSIVKLMLGDPRLNSKTLSEALYLAVGNDKIEATVMLIEDRRLDSEAISEALRLLVSRQKIEALKTILEEARLDPLQRSTVLHLVVRDGTLKMIQAMLAQGILDIDAVDEDGLTPLAVAVELQRGDKVRLLIESGGADVNFPKSFPLSASGRYKYLNNGNYVFEFAVRSQHRELVMLLLERSKMMLPLSLAFDEMYEEKDAWESQRNKSRAEILHLVVQQAHANGSLFSYVLPKGRTMLHIAVHLRNVALREEIVKSIINDPNGTIDLAAADQDGNNALHHAVVVPDLQGTIKALCDHSLMDINACNNNLETPFIRACASLNMHNIDTLLTYENIDVNKVDSAGNSAIHHLMHTSLRYTFLKRALRVCCNKFHANLDVKNKGGHTPLSKAVAGEYEAHVRLLLKLGADPSGFTVYHATEYVGQIINTIKNPSATDQDGNTALHRAVLMPDSQDTIMAICDQPQLDINVCNKNLETPFLRACARLKEQSINTLLLYEGIDVNKADSAGDTAVHHLVHASFGTKFLKRVLRVCYDKFDANLDTKNQSGHTPLSKAAAVGYETHVRLLLELGADPNVPDARGRTALHLAAKFVNLSGRYTEYSDVADTILRDKRTDVNAIDMSGETPIFKAVGSTKDKHATVNENVYALELTKALLRQGTSTYIVNAEGYTVLRLAKQIGFTLVVEELRAHESAHSE